MCVSERIKAKGAKRILALDGGGIRGVLTIQLLKRLEKIVQSRTGNSNAVLSDYFDLIGGTSTGAIIAAALSLGWKVDQIDELYRQLGNSIFQSKWYRKGLFRAKFSPEPLRKALEVNFGDIELGGSEIKTGLAIMLKRIDTGSPWIVHNNTAGPCFEENRNYRLSQIVRASTAAPHYFKPETIHISSSELGAFVDGGVSPHNNPSLQLFMLSTLSGHAFEWEMGSDKLLVVSLGTGTQETSLEASKVEGMKAAGLAVKSLTSLMNDASSLNETIMQWISNSPTAREIDMEIGDLTNDLLGGQPLCTYLRYQTWFTPSWLEEKLNIKLSTEEADKLLAMDDPKNMTELIEIGQKAASILIDDEHFPAEFNL